VNSGRSPALISSDYGTNWTSLGYNSLAALYPHYYGINDTYMYVGLPYGGGGVFRCSVDSSTWYNVKSNMNDGAHFQSIFVYGSNIYVGNDGRGGIFHSSDNGTNWTTINNGLRSDSTNFSVIAVNGSNIFAGTTAISYWTSVVTPKGIYHSTDNGASWNTSNNGLPGTNITDIVISSSSVIAATDSNGIFLSEDNGASWTPCNDGLPNPYISSLAINDNYVYAGLLGGIWRRPLSEVVSVEEQNSPLPKNYSLEQNYPNPFNPSTTINYGLPVSGFASLKIFDMLGREVKILINERQEAGSHAITFNATNLPSGVYFYQLKAGSYTETKKLVLLK